MHASSILSRMKGKEQGVGPFPLFAMSLPDRHAENGEVAHHSTEALVKRLRFEETPLIRAGGSVPSRNSGLFSEN